VAHRRSAQSWIKKGWRFAKTASHNHPVTGARRAVTDRAEDLIAALAPIEDLFREWEGKFLNIIRIGSVALRSGGARRRSRRLRILFGAPVATGPVVLPIFLPVKNSLSSRSQPRGTVPSTKGRDDKPSLKKGDER